MIIGDDPGPRRLVSGQTAFFVLLPTAARAGIIAARLAHSFSVFAFNGAKANRGWKILQYPWQADSSPSNWAGGGGLPNPDAAAHGLHAFGEMRKDPRNSGANAPIKSRIQKEPRVKGSSILPALI
jgi:hypothetical protein